MKQPKIIKIVPYDPLWPHLFTLEAASIATTLGSNCLAIHHIGSTSVPGLSAKPIIDIILVVHNPQDAQEQLQTIGIRYKGEYNIPLHYGFNKREGTYLNVHVYEEGHPEIELNLVFRDYLRTHSETRNAYAALKEELLLDATAGERHNSAFSNYTLKKGDFIRSVLEKAHFDRLLLRKCNDHTEWSTAQQFRNTYFFKPQNSDDPYTWTFNHPEHVHLILYRGTVIVGYAHIQLWQHNRAALRMIVIDEAHRNNKYGSTFLQLIESWLKAHNYISIHTQARTTATNFYKKNGYSPMAFNDPHEHANDPHDVALGKIL